MPSSILNSDDGVISGTSGIKAVGGDDGVLVFQSKGTETARINTDKQIVAAAGTASLPVLTTTGDLNTGIYFPAADNIGFATNGVIRGRWTTDGLCFNTDTAAANALDDYEEGDWTPTWVVASGTITANSTNTGAKYVKIGRVVYVTGFISYTSNASASGIIKIGNLPFVPIEIGYPSASFGGALNIGYTFGWAGESPRGGYFRPDSTIQLLYASTATGNLNSTNEFSDMTNSNNFNQIEFSGFFMVA